MKWNEIINESLDAADLDSALEHFDIAIDDLRWYLSQDHEAMWMNALTGELLPAQEHEKPHGIKIHRKKDNITP